MLKINKTNNGDGPILPLIDSDDGHDLKNELRPSPRRTYFGNNTRLLIVALSWFCLSCAVGNSLTLNFTVICMRKLKTKVKDGSLGLLRNLTEDTDEFEPFYDSAEQAFLFSAIAIGCLVGAAPISLLITRFGTRSVFTIYGLVSGVSMLLMPPAVYSRIELVFLMRFLQGIGASTSFVMMGTVTAEWSPFASSGTYLSFISTHLQMSKIIAMPAAGLLCESEFGWPMVYFVQGAVTIVFFLLFFVFYRNSASEHRNVSPVELDILQRDKIVCVVKSPNKRQKPDPVPHRAILSDPAVLGAVISLCGGNLSYQIFSQFAPTYLNKVLELNVEHTGFTSAVPALLCIGLKLVVGPLSDRMPISPRARVIFFASISQFVMSICLLVLAYLPEGNAFMGQLFFTLAYLFSGLNVVGVIKSCQLISGRFVHFIMALNSLSTSLAILLLPPAITHFAPNNNREEWTRILVFIAVFCCVVTTIFDFTAQATPRPWVAKNRRADSIGGDENDEQLVERAKNLIC